MSSETKDRIWPSGAAEGDNAAILGNEPDASVGTGIDDAEMTPFLRKITVFSSGGAFIEGYVMSIIGVALVLLTPQLAMSAAWEGAVGASMLVGLLIGNIIGGRMTDTLGRRIMFIIDVIAVAVFSLISMFATNVVQVFVTRLLIGVFIGADYPISTSLIAEFSPKKHRAIAMSVVSAAWYVGATAAAIVGFLCYNLPNGWQLMLGSSAVPAIILLVGRRDIPESPRWLMSRGRVDEARAVIAKVYGKAYDVDIKEEPEAKTSFRKVLDKGYLRLMVFLGVITMCEVIPMTAIYTFGPSILSALGLGEGTASILGEAAISGFFLLGTAIAAFLFDVVGRRRLLIWGFALMTIGLGILGVWSDAPIHIVFLAFGLYAIAYGGPGTLQWLYPNELFPTEVRATAVGVSLGFASVGNVIAIYALPIFLESFGIGPTMLVAIFLLLIGLIWSIIVAPETTGLSLAESASLGKRYAKKVKRC